MSQHASPEVSIALPVQPGGPERPLEKILAASAKVLTAIDQHRRDRSHMERARAAITSAEAFMAEVAAASDVLRQAVEPADLDAITRQLQAFVTVWPNAPEIDLTGYGTQLADDVVERQPCRYALREGLRYVRQTSKVLPSIAEVLAALDAAQGRLRNSAYHIGRMPAEIEIARADLAKAEASEADRAAYRLQHAASRKPEE